MISPIITGIVKLPLVVKALVAVIVIVGSGVLLSLTTLKPEGVLIAPNVQATISLPHITVIFDVIDCVPLTALVVP